MEYKRQNALVTGLSNGIGSATAIALAREGYHVGLTYRSKASYERCLEVYSECRQYGGDIQMYQVELSERDAAERLICQFLEHYGTIDVLTNNAGGALKIPKGEFDEMPLDYWEEQIALN